MNALVTRPSVLRAIDAPKPWGWELWLTSTRSEGPAGVAGSAGSLAELAAAHPEVLGRWSRRLFGDEMPIFAKLIHTDFPTRVHLGFRRSIGRGELLALLEREQELLRELFAVLRVPDEPAFAEYQAAYSAWASEQALSAWRRDDDDASASSLRRFVAPSFGLVRWLRDVRHNRAAIVDTLNDVDLRRESGNLLLTSAGIVHAIFGLSHQTHPSDRSRAATEALFALLAERSAAGAADDELGRLIDAAGLADLRAGNVAPPKNEAWLPMVVSGSDVLVEPQQTSDTTYSIADFCTPLTWGGDVVRFRKGEPAHGLSREKLSGYLADVDFAVTSIDALRRSPTPVAGGPREGAELFRLVDEPTTWPFFTAYQIELTGRVTAGPPPGVFQQLVVARGRVEIGDEDGAIGEMTPRAPAFVPATVSGRYTLTAKEPSTVLVFAVPGARGGAPQL